MNLSISNIAWTNQNDEKIYAYLKQEGFKGLEIAPTRIILQNPYDNLEKAKEFSMDIKQRYGLGISSMQSIWYGRNEEIFNSKKEREVLIRYTKKAIKFAKIIGCKNLVFGCPKNRNTQDVNDMNIAISFFKELGEYACINNTVLSIEPNPVIYNTNFINYTSQAFEIAKEVNNNGFKVNVDLGTIIYNQEDVRNIADNIELVNHIHVSEPNLDLIEKRVIHNQIADILKQVDYQRFVSIEMGKRNNLDEVKETIEYIKEVFA